MSEKGGTLQIDDDLTSKDRSITAVLGTSGVGKSSLMNQLAITHIERGLPVLVVDLQRQFEHLGEASISPAYSDLTSGAFIQELFAMDWRGLLILDDLDAYLYRKVNLPQPWAELFTSNRHKRIDVIANARRPQETPSLVLAVARYLAIFQNRQDAKVRAALQDELSGYPGAYEAIPQEKHRYLWLDKETGDFRVHKTIALPEVKR